MKREGRDKLERWPPTTTDQRHIKRADERKNPAMWLSDELDKARVAVYICTCSQNEPELTLKFAKAYYMDALTRYIDASQITFYCEVLNDACDNRPERSKLLNDCGAGKCDLIITHSENRFAGSDCAAAQIVKSLKALDPSVRVRFEDEASDKLSFHPLAVRSIASQKDTEETAAECETDVVKLAVYCRVSATDVDRRRHRIEGE